MMPSPRVMHVPADRYEALLDLAELSGYERTANGANAFMSRNTQRQWIVIPRNPDDDDV